eukprot:gene8366-10275_t
MTLLIQVFILCYLISKAVIKFQMLDNKTTIAQFSNDECSNLNPECDIGYKFKRVLFFYNDGLARDLSDDLIKMFNGRANTFRIQNEGFPASYAVFSSYVTGTPPTNFMGNPISNDNIIYQLKSNGIKMKYYGTRMPAYDVLEKGAYFEKVILEYVTGHDSKLYSNLFECKSDSPQKCAKELLDANKKDGYSIFFSGDVIDERNHMTGNKLDTTTLSIIRNWTSNMNGVKEWIDENPEYLLVVLSDHGGKLLSETAAHGSNNGGNEAFMVIYNPNVQPLPMEDQDKFIDQVDVCATIWQHFAGSGVSLPAENIGKVRPTTIDPHKIYQTLKLNANQLNRFGHRWGYKMNQKDYNHAIELADADVDKSIQLFNRYIDSLKIPFLNLKRFPMLEVVLFPIVIFLLISSLLAKQYGSFKQLSKEFKTNPALVVIPYLVIFGITGLFSGFWVLYWHDNNESIHMYVATLLATLVMYYSPKALINEEKLSSSSGSSVDENEMQIYYSNQQQQQQQDEYSSKDKKILSGSSSIIPTSISYSYEYQQPSAWVIRYALYNFFMAVSLYLLTIPLEDLLLVHLYSKSHLLAIIFLSIEFYIQFKKIKAHCGKPGLRMKDRYYYPLYIKFLIYYLIILGVYYYDYSWRNGKHMKAELAGIIYFVLGTHSIVLLFSPRYLQADLFLPFSTTLYFLSNDKEINFFSGITDHFLPFVVLLMTSIALSCYKAMEMNFQIGDVAIYVPGVFDPPTKPVFSGFIMAFHKLGYFFLLGAFLIKFANPCPPVLYPRYWLKKKFTFGYKTKNNADFDRIVESLNIQVWGFLMLLLLCSLFFFHLGYYNFMITKAFVFTVTISVIVVFYGSSLVTSYLGRLIKGIYCAVVKKNPSQLYNILPSQCVNRVSPSIPKYKRISI